MIQFDDLPEVIRERMLEEQEKQGNPRSTDVFREDLSTGSREGGFQWENTTEGWNCWSEIIFDGDVSAYFHFHKLPLPPEVLAAIKADYETEFKRLTKSFAGKIGLPLTVTIIVDGENCQISTKIALPCED